MKHPLDTLDQHFSLPEVQKISLDRPTAWLKAGWRDLRANPIPSLAYGLLFGIAGDLILLASLNRPHLFTAAISGFFILAPILAAGLYELSRQHGAGRRPTFIESLSGLGRRAESLAQLGLVFALLGLVWERTSAIIFAMLGGDANVDATHFVTQIVTTSDHRAFLVAWFVGGGFLALLTFAISVVSVPMVLDRDCDVVTAMMTSLRACAANLEALVLWAAIIVALTLLGFGTLLFGLVLFMPILGHASWHAYKELVK